MKASNPDSLRKDSLNTHNAKAVPKYAEPPVIRTTGEVCPPRLLGIQESVVSVYPSSDKKFCDWKFACAKTETPACKST
jgi:hypothetical protein